eukprot:1083048-Pleurochrysis_carterae.AAC.1
MGSAKKYAAQQRPSPPHAILLELARAQTTLHHLAHYLAPSRTTSIHPAPPRLISRHLAPPRACGGPRDPNGYGSGAIWRASISCSAGEKIRHCASSSSAEMK